MNVSCPDCRSIFRVDPAKVPPSGVRARCSVCGGVISIPAPTGQSTTPAGSQRPSPTSNEPSSTPPRPTPQAKSGWDQAIFGEPVQRPPAAPSFPAPSVPRPAAPPPAPRSAEVPAAPRPRPESIERSTAAATATPPSPTSGVPEFAPASQTPAHPPFRPSGAPPRSTPATQPSGEEGAVRPFVPSAPRAPTPVSSSQASATPSAPFNVTPARPSNPPSAAVPAASDGGARRPLNPFLSKDPNQRAKRLARALVSDIITYHPAKHAEGLRDGTLKQLFREEIKKSFEEYIAQVGQPLAEGTTYFQEALNEVLAAGKKIF
jgi:predicted Zn finger-like uncharacterized protein